MLKSHGIKNAHVNRAPRFNFEQLLANLRAQNCAIWTAFAVLTFACSGPGNQALSTGTLGLQITPIAGNYQADAPSAIYPLQLNVQITDQTDGLPVPYLPVTFMVLDSPDAAVTTPTVTTNSQGLAITTVRAPSAINTTFHVQAAVAGTAITTEFTLSTSLGGTVTHYVVDTTHGSIETAGVPFAYILKVVDGSGQIITDFNGTVDMNWEVQTNTSWASANTSLPAATNVIPLAIMPVTFVNGMYTSPSTYVLTDSRAATQVWVGDTSQSIEDTQAHNVTVLPNLPYSLLIDTAAGGPNGGATIFPITGVDFTTDQPTQTFYGAVVDEAGNYLSDVANASWVISNQSFKDPSQTGVWATVNGFVPAAGGNAASITPTITGGGTLTVTAAGLSAANTPIYVDPGPAYQLLLSTQHNSVELAGVHFAVTVKAVDAKGNVLSGNSLTGAGAYNGNFPIIFTIQNARSAAHKLSTCQNMMSVGADFTAVPIVAYTSGGLSGACSGTTWAAFAANPSLTTETFNLGSVTLINGISTSTVTAQLNWLSSYGLNNITIGATLTPLVSQNLATLAGAVNHITVNQSYPLMFNLFDRPLSNASPIPICQRVFQEFYDYNTATNDLGGTLTAGTAIKECPNLKQASGSGSITYYAGLEDQGGNLISTTPPSVAMNGFGNSTNDWSFGANASATFTPTYSTPANSGIFFYDNTSRTINSGGATAHVQNNMNDTVSPLAIDHYALSVGDGTDPTNVLSAIYNYGITVIAQDIHNNTVTGLNGAVSLSFVSTDPASGAAVFASPSGTAAVVAASSLQSYNFGAGVTSLNSNVVTGQRLICPNVSGITITVTDSNGITGSLTPAVIPGPINTIEIHDAPGGTGNNLTSQAVNLTTTSTENFYVAGFDAQKNYLGAYAAGSWTDQHTSPNYALNSLGSLAGVTFPISSSAKVVYSPTLAGSGILSVTSGGLTASTGLVSVVVSPVNALQVVTQHQTTPGYETSGTAFTTQVSLVDSKNNVILYNGSLTLTATILGNSSTLTGYSNGAVPGGGSPTSYNFVNGVMSPSLNFTLYNAAVTPVIYFRISSGTVTGQDVSGISGSSSVTVKALAAQNIFMSTAGVSSIAAQSVVTYHLSMIDQYGNVVTTGTGSSQSVTVNFADTLTNHEITATSLTGATPTPSVGGGITSLVGTLSSGVATVGVRAKQTGTIQPRVVTGNGGMDSLLVTADIPVVAGTPTQLVLSTNASATYATGAGINLVVQIEDAYNNVVTTGSDSTSTIGLTLSQTGNSSPPSLQGTSSIAAVAGVATFPSGSGGLSTTAYVTAPNVAPNPVGVYKITVAKTTGTSVSSVLTTTFSVSAGTATQLVFTQTPPASVTADTIWAMGNRPIVKIEDAWGNIVTTGASATQTIYLYPYKQAVALTVRSGRPPRSYRVDLHRLPQTPGSLTSPGLSLQYTDATTSSTFYVQANNSSGLATCTSTGTTITAGAASKLSNSNYPTGITANTQVLTAVSPAPQFQVQDAYGNGVSGVTVNFAFGTLPPNTPTGQALSVSSAVSGSTGLVTVGVTVGSKVGVSGNLCSNGTYPVIASSTGLTSATLNAIAVAGAASKLAFVNAAGTTLQPQATGSGQMVGANFQTQGDVEIQDAASNCVGNVAATLVTLSPFTASGCATAATGVTLANTTATTSSGVAAFSGLNASALSSTAGTAFYIGANASGFSQICTTVSSAIWNQLSITPSGTQTTSTGTTVNFAATGGVNTTSWSLPNKNSAASGVSGCLGPYTAAVTVGSVGWCPSTASSCVTYTPGCVGGGSSDSIKVLDSSNNSLTDNITVNGPKLTISSSPTPVGSTNWGTDSTNVTQTFTVTNSGNAAMSTGNLVAPTLSPDAYPGTNRFTVNDVSCSNAVLAVGGTCTFQVTFQPCGSGVCPTDPQGYPDGYTFTEPSGDLHVDANPGGRATLAITGTKQ